MGLRKAVSVIVPTLNEAGNVKPLVERIDASLRDTGITYEIVFVDDHSVDKTCENILKLSKKYPISLHKKTGERGKAYSLLEGFKHAKYDILCMIDADLQYPPEAISPMFELICVKDADLVLSERLENQTSFMRKLSSKTFNFIFTRSLFGFNYDTQSGLKLFKRKVIDKLSLDPTPWSFDLEFIVRALEQNFKIVSYQIVFSERQYGVAKVKLLQVTYELAKASLQLRRKTSTKRVKLAYEKNQRFSKKVMGTLSFVIGLGIFAAFNLAYLPASAQLGVPQAVQPAVPQILDPSPEQPSQVAPPTVQTPVPSVNTPTAPQRPAAPANNSNRNQTSNQVQPTGAPAQNQADMGAINTTPLNSSATPIKVETGEGTFPQYLNFEDKYGQPENKSTKLPYYIAGLGVVAGAAAILTATNEPFRMFFSSATIRVRRLLHV